MSSFSMKDIHTDSRLVDPETSLSNQSLDFLKDYSKLQTATSSEYDLVPIAFTDNSQKRPPRNALEGRTIFGTTIERAAGRNGLVVLRLRGPGDHDVANGKIRIDPMFSARIARDRGNPNKIHVSEVDGITFDHRLLPPLKVSRGTLEMHNDGRVTLTTQALGAARTYHLPRSMKPLIEEMVRLAERK